MHKIRALCPLIRTEPLKKATTGRRRERLRQNLLRSYASLDAQDQGLCPLIRTEPLKKATAGRGHERLQQGGVNGYIL